MCFSATASFIAGGVLAVTGVFSISQVKNRDHLPFAAIPLIFGIQQLLEGVLWLTFSDPELYWLHDPSKYAFLTFAHIVWPFWIPFSILLLEDRGDRWRVSGLRLLGTGGLVISVLLLYGLLFHPATASVKGCHVDYDIDSPTWLRAVTVLFYFGAIVVAPFFSSYRSVRVLAKVNVVSLFATAAFFEVWFASVWCFFAAIQSIIIVFILREFRDSASMDGNLKKEFGK